MSARLEFFFDYVSVYSYLADSQLEALGASEIIYRPMLLGAVMQATGNRPPATVAAKGKYLNSDIYRWSEVYGIPLTWNPVFPLNTIHALRVAIVAQRRGEFAGAHRALFDAAWVHKIDIGQADELVRVVAGAGLDSGAYAAAITEQDVKDELKANTDEAVARGVFGAPSMFVGDELFFGNDRFDFIRKALHKTT